MQIIPSMIPFEREHQLHDHWCAIYVQSTPRVRSSTLLVLSSVRRKMVTDGLSLAGYWQMDLVAKVFRSPTWTYNSVG